jgi:ankyrin repeat protein
VDATVQDLAEAVKVGDISSVRTILHARPRLIGMDLSENNEHRALHFAVLKRDPEMVKLLMEAGADARKGIYPHRDATSALTIAKEREYDELVAIIEEEERLRREELSCPNATVSPVQDQISAAISNGENALAIQLLEADPTLIQACDRSGATPLHIAAEEGNVEMLDWLLQRRAKVNKRDVQERTPLDRAALAVADSFPVIAKLLLSYGAELTAIGAVALNDVQRVVQAGPGLLSLAVKHGHIEMVRRLLELGADVDERTFLDQLEQPVASWGMPLWSAASDNQYEIAEVLLDHGADPNANVYASGWPLGRAWNHEDGRLRQLLIARGAKLQPYMVSATHNVEEARRLLANDSSEELAQELLWSAADSGCPEIVALALQKIDWPRDDSRWHWIMIQPVRGATADHASREGHFECMRLLLRHGVDPNISRYGQTVLHFAAAYRGSVSDEDRAAFAAMLIDYGAGLSRRDDLLKSTPLGWACRWGRRKLAELLISRGASAIESEAEAWATPSAWAKKMNHADLLEIILPGSLQ